MRALEGQMSIFDDVLVTLLEQMSEIPVVDVPKRENMETYLQKGERILSLARAREVREFKKIGFMECFNFTKYSTYRVHSDKISYIKLAMAKFMKGLQESTEGIKTALCEIGDDIQITQLEEDCYENRLLRAVCKKKKTSYTTGYRIELKGFKEPLLMPSKPGLIATTDCGHMFTLRSGGTQFRCVDFSRFFGTLAIFLNLRSVVGSLLQDSAEMIYQELYQKQVEHIESKYKNLDIIGLHEDVANEEAICTFLDGINVKYCTWHKDSKITGRYLNQYDFTILYLLGKAPLTNFKHELAYNKYGKSYYLDLSNGVSDFLLVDAFDIIFEQYMMEKEEYEYQNSSKSEYARSYQTKKNLSDKLIKSMEKSKWNKHFGYVEFDSDCDLSLVEGLESEFEKIAELYGWTKQESVSIRFRRLGNHKAAGLYFSRLKCICVDINHPGSLIHEYFHMIDYLNGSLSKQSRFIPMYMRYKECLDKYYLGEDIGGTKYNKAYYSMPTEVFARCGEMYLQRVKGIASSVIKPLQSFAYPDDDKLNELIKDYYSQLLERD